MMQPPANTKIYDTPSSTFWFDEDGIICSIQKKIVVQPTLDEVKEQLEFFKMLLGDKKVCMLIDVTNSVESSRENRDYAANEFPKFVKAIAMVSKSALGKMLANLFFTLKTQPYPTKMFNDVPTAKEWLKQYL